MKLGLLGGLAALLLAAACSGPAGGASGGRVLNVIAAENFWGSIATQLGGSHVKVQSVMTDPNADPHLYGSNANDARAIATADLVIMNGAGYDDWVSKLLDANRSGSRRVLNVASSLGKKAGDNPHFWYGPQYVVRVADLVTAQFKAIDPADASAFDSLRSSFTTTLRPYNDRLAEIKQKFSSVKIGATESIFVYMAQYTGLDLISPPAFMQAISEGNEPPAAAVVTFQQQVVSKAIKVLVYNVQTPSDVTTNVRHQAAAADIPVVGVSETLQPQSATFQDWQLAQLITLENALDADALAS